MELVLTKHAVERAKQRRVPISWLRKTIETPTAISKGKEGKEIAFREFGTKVVEVVFVKDKNKIIVISARWG